MGGPPSRTAGAGHRLWADYRRRYAHRAERPARAAALLVPRLGLDPSLQAALLLRALEVAPPGLRGAIRRALLCGHAIYVDDDVEIGGGAFLPHPVAIALGRGSRIGAGVSVFHNVSVRPTHEGAPRVADGACLYAGAVVAGPVHVGADAVIGAGAEVHADVPPGARVRRPADGRADPVGPAGAPLASAPPGGLRAALAADHRARFGASSAPPSLVRLVRDALADRSFRVVVIARAMHHGPRPAWRVWRRLLLGHGCDIGVDAQLGPGLHLPCPVGVVVGRRAVLGAGVELHEHTTVTPTTRAWRPDPGPLLQIGDRSCVLPGAGVFGALTLAAGAVVAPRAVVHPGHGRAPERPPERPPVRIRPPRRAPAPGLYRLILSDLRRLAPLGGPADRWRALTGLPFQAALLIRVTTAGPARASRAAGMLLRGLHHCYVDAGVRIGPGLAVPLPCGIRLEDGVEIGAAVTILDRVSLINDQDRIGPTVADGVVLPSGTVAIGPRLVDPRPSPDRPPGVTSWQRAPAAR